MLTRAGSRTRVVLRLAMRRYAAALTILLLLAASCSGRRTTQDPRPHGRLSYGLLGGIVGQAVYSPAAKRLILEVERSYGDSVIVRSVNGRVTVVEVGLFDGERHFTAQSLRWDLPFAPTKLGMLQVQNAIGPPDDRFQKFNEGSWTYLTAMKECSLKLRFERGRVYQVQLKPANSPELKKGGRSAPAGRNARASLSYGQLVEMTGQSFYRAPARKALDAIGSVAPNTITVEGENSRVARVTVRYPEGDGSPAVTPPAWDLPFAEKDLDAMRVKKALGKPYQRPFGHTGYYVFNNTLKERSLFVGYAYGRLNWLGFEPREPFVPPRPAARADMTVLEKRLPRPDFSKLTPLKVSKVLDSDTIVVTDGSRRFTIHLRGVLSPQLKNFGRTNALFGNVAKEFTTSLLEGRKVWLIPKEGPAFNMRRFGWTTAYVYRCPDGLFVNTEIIRRGYGAGRTGKGFEHPHAKFFADLTACARRARRGPWDNPPAKALEEWRRRYPPWDPNEKPPNSPLVDSDEIEDIPLKVDIQTKKKPKDKSSK